MKASEFKKRILQHPFCLDNEDGYHNSNALHCAPIAPCTETVNNKDLNNAKRQQHQLNTDSSTPQHSKHKSKNTSLSLNASQGSTYFRACHTKKTQAWLNPLSAAMLVVGIFIGLAIH